MEKVDHLTDDPSEVNRVTWLHDDAKLILPIRNSIESHVFSMVSHCETVKELMNYLAFLYSGKQNITL